MAREHDPSVSGTLPAPTHAELSRIPLWRYGRIIHLDKRTVSRPAGGPHRIHVYELAGLHQARCLGCTWRSSQSEDPASLSAECDSHLHPPPAVLYGWWPARETLVVVPATEARLRVAEIERVARCTTVLRLRQVAHQAETVGLPLDSTELAALPGDQPFHWAQAPYAKTGDWPIPPDRLAVLLLAPALLDELVRDLGAEVRDDPAYGRHLHVPPVARDELLRVLLRHYPRFLHDEALVAALAGPAALGGAV